MLPLVLFFLLLIKVSSKNLDLYVRTDGSGNSCSTSSPCSISEAFKKLGGKIVDVNVNVYLKPGIYDISSQEKAYILDPILETVVILRWNSMTSKLDETDDIVTIQSSKPSSEAFINVDLSSWIHKHSINIEFREIGFSMEKPVISDSLDQIDPSKNSSPNTDTLGTITFTKCEWKNSGNSIFSTPTSFKTIVMNDFSYVGNKNPMKIEVRGPATIDITQLTYQSNANPLIISGGKMELLINGANFASNDLSRATPTIRSMISVTTNEKSNVKCFFSDFTLSNNIFPNSTSIFSLTNTGENLDATLETIKYGDNPSPNCILYPLSVISKGGSVGLKSIEYPPATNENENTYSVYKIEGADLNVDSHVFRGTMGIVTTSSVGLKDSQFLDSSIFSIDTSVSPSSVSTVVVDLSNVTFETFSNPIHIQSENVPLDLRIFKCLFWNYKSLEEETYFLNIQAGEEFSIRFQNISFFDNQGSVNINTVTKKTSTRKLFENFNRIEIHDVSILSYQYQSDSPYFEISSQTPVPLDISILEIFYSVIDNDQNAFHFFFSTTENVTVDLHGGNFITSATSSVQFLSIEYEQEQGSFLACSLQEIELVNFIPPEFSVPSIGLKMSNISITQNPKREPFRISTTDTGESTASFIEIESINMMNVDGIVISSENEFMEIQLRNLAFISTEHIVQVHSSASLALAFDTVQFIDNINGMTFSAPSGLHVGFSDCSFVGNEKLFELVTLSSDFSLVLQSVVFQDNSNQISLISYFDEENLQNEIGSVVRVDNCRFLSNKIFDVFVESLFSVQAPYLSSFVFTGNYISGNSVNSQKGAIIRLNAAPICATTTSTRTNEDVNLCEISDNYWSDNQAGRISGIEWVSLINTTVPILDPSPLYVRNELSSYSTTGASFHFHFSGDIPYYLYNLNFTNFNGPSMLCISGTTHDIKISEINCMNSMSSSSLIILSETSENSVVSLNGITISRSIVQKYPLIYLENLHGKLTVSDLFVSGNTMNKAALEVSNGNIVEIDNFSPVGNEIIYQPMRTETSLLRIDADTIVLSNFRMTQQNRNVPSCYEVTNSKSLTVRNSAFSICSISMKSSCVSDTLSFQSVSVTSQEISIFDLPSDISFSDVSVKNGRGISLTNVASFSGKNLFLSGNKKSDGGGLSMVFGNKTTFLEISESSIVDNDADGGFGGGIFIQTKSDFSFSSEKHIGKYDISLCIEDPLYQCNISGNRAMYGGGVFFGVKDMNRIRSNASVFQNSAYKGGGVYVESFDRLQDWKKTLGVDNIFQNSATYDPQLSFLPSIIFVAEKNLTCVSTIFSDDASSFICKISSVEIYDVTGRKFERSAFPVDIGIGILFNGSKYLGNGIIWDSDSFHAEIEVISGDVNQFHIGEVVFVSVALFDDKDYVSETPRDVKLSFSKCPPNPPPPRPSHHKSNQAWIVLPVLSLFCIFFVCASICCLVFFAIILVSCLLLYSYSWKRTNVNINGSVRPFSFFGKSGSVEQREIEEEEFGEYDVIFESWLNRQLLSASTNPSSPHSHPNQRKFEINSKYNENSPPATESTPLMEFPAQTPSQPSSFSTTSDHLRNRNTFSQSLELDDRRYDELRDDGFEEKVIEQVMLPVEFSSQLKSSGFENYHWVTAPLQLLICNIGMMRSLNEYSSTSECAKLLSNIRLSSALVVHDEPLDDEFSSPIISFLEYCLKHDIVNIDMVNPIVFLISIFERLRSEGCGLALNRYVRWKTQETLSCVRCNQKSRETKIVDGEVLKIDGRKYHSVQEYFTNYFGSITSSVSSRGDYCHTCKMVMRYATFKCELKSDFLPKYAMVGIESADEDFGSSSLGSNFSSSSSLGSFESSESLDQQNRKGKRKKRRRRLFKVNDTLRIGFGAVYSLWGVLIEQNIRKKEKDNSILEVIVEEEKGEEEEEDKNKTVLISLIKKGIYWFTTKELREMMNKKLFFESRRELVELASKMQKGSRKKMEKFWMVYDSQHMKVKTEEISGEDNLKKYMYKTLSHQKDDSIKIDNKCVFLVYKRIR